MHLERITSENVTGQEVLSLKSDAILRVIFRGTEHLHAKVPVAKCWSLKDLFFWGFLPLLIVLSEDRQEMGGERERGRDMQ